MATIVPFPPRGAAGEKSEQLGSEEVRSQLARILASPFFERGEPFASLLRYVVAETLEGRGGNLNERVLGCEIFGCGAAYDTQADPVVRVSASEVRRLIAEYYREPGHESEIRIHLPFESYVPEFGLPTMNAKPPVAGPAASGNLLALVRHAVRLKPVWLGSALAIALMGLVAVVAVEMKPGPTATERFWNPVLGSSQSLVIALGNSSEPLQRASPPSDLGPTLRDVRRGDNLAFCDAITMARIAAFTRGRGNRNLDIRRAVDFTLGDLRKGPVVLVGAFNNPWTLRLCGALRFAYVRDSAARIAMICDRQNPSRTWVDDPSQPYARVTQEYAVVSRFLDPLTEQMVVVVAGLGRDGTAAAGEFATEDRYLGLLASRAPKHWENMSLQVVLATDIVDGKNGPPRILATHFW